MAEETTTIESSEFDSVDFDSPVVSTEVSEDVEAEAIQEGTTTEEPSTEIVEETAETDVGTEDYSPISPREQALIDRLNALEAKQLDASSGPPQLVVPEIAAQEHNFLDGIDMDDLLGDPAKLNAVLSAVYNKALQQASRIALEQTYQTMPATVLHFSRQQYEMQETIRDFYRQNPELLERKATVGSVANEIAVTHPEYTVAQLLDESAKQVRKMLGLKQQAQEQVKEIKKTPTPGFAKQRSGGGRVKQEELSALEKEMAEL